MFCPICSSPTNSGEVRCASCGSPISPSDVATSQVLPQGTRLAGGRYLTGAVLGRGGFGITYLSQMTRSGIPVAIKEFFPEGSLRDGLRAMPGNTTDAKEFKQSQRRFNAEARILQCFEELNIVHVVEIFGENGTSYIVMEYLHGKTLEQLLSQHRRFTESDAIRYALSLGKALTAVHRQGFLHGDVKPANVMLCADGRIVLFDFGTAMKLAGSTEGRAAAMLTPGYAALEQYGRTTQVGAYTDVYGLAATVYHMLVGQAPTSATDRVAGVGMATPHWASPELVGETISALIMGAMSIEVDKRPPTIADFLRDIESYHKEFARTAGSVEPEFSRMRWYERPMPTVLPYISWTFLIIFIVIVQLLGLLVK